VTLLAYAFARNETFDELVFGTIQAEMTLPDLALGPYKKER
jgi:hypothetical protein